MSDWLTQKVKVICPPGRITFSVDIKMNDFAFDRVITEEGREG